jgi:hypothetical protein
MAIRFGWTRPQASPKTSDDDAVAEESIAPPEPGGHAAPEATDTGDVPPGTEDDSSETNRVETDTTPADVPDAAPSAHDQDVAAADGGDRGTDGDARATVVPATEVPPTEVPPTEVPPTEVPPANVASTVNTSESGTVTSPSPEMIEAIRQVHERVLETERRTHRIIGAAAARRVHHDTLVEESDALRAIGFESFSAFVAVYGDTAATEETAAPGSEPRAELAEETAGETIGRIRVLLSELGIEPGVDPLQAAKEFLDVVESPDTAPLDLASPTGEVAPPAPVAEVAPVAEIPVVEEPVVEEPVVEEPVEEPVAATVVDDQALELALARAELSRASISSRSRWWSSAPERVASDSCRSWASCDSRSADRAPASSRSAVRCAISASAVRAASWASASSRPSCSSS